MRHHGRILLSTVTAAVVGLTVLPGLAAPASATPGSNLGELATALSTCAGTEAAPYTVTLQQDLVGTTTELIVGCVASIDLTGFDLTVRNVAIGEGQALEVTDTSPGAGAPGILTANATGSNYVPGVMTTRATLVTSGRAQVNATGGFYAAGIGGSWGEPGGTLVSNNSSVVVATSGVFASGIGGGNQGAGGSTTTNDSASVTGTSVNQGAGIGGGRTANGGTTTSNDTSTIVGSSGYGGAGIGGGTEGAGGTTTSNGSSLLTGNGSEGAGIGSGMNAGGPGSTTVTGGSTVRARAYTSSSAIGLGAGATPPPGTYLTVEHGTLELGSDLRVPDTLSSSEPEVLVGNAGVIRRASGGNAAITGAGSIQNDGSITLPKDAVGVNVNRHHYLVGFEPGTGVATPTPITVYATSFVAGDRALPDLSVHDPDFEGWNTERDGTGLMVGAATVLPGLSLDGTPVAITLYALFDKVVVAVPTITNLTSNTRGSAAPEVGDVLAAAVGTMDPSDATVTFAWRCGAAPGTPCGNGALHLVTAEEAGTTLTAIATATRRPYAPGVASSVPTGAVRAVAGVVPPVVPPVDPPPIVVPPVVVPPVVVQQLLAQVLRPTPKVMGTPRVGRKLTARAGDRDPGVRVSYKWFASGTRIRNATGRTLLLRAAQQGKRISVRVTATKPGYLRVVQMSRRTSPVRAD